METAWQDPSLARFSPLRMTIELVLPRSDFVFRPANLPFSCWANTHRNTEADRFQRCPSPIDTESAKARCLILPGTIGKFEELQQFVKRNVPSLRKGTNLQIDVARSARYVNAQACVKKRADDRASIMAQTGKCRRICVVYPYISEIEGAMVPLRVPCCGGRHCFIVL